MTHMAHLHLLTILRPNGQTEVVDMAAKGWGPGRLADARIAEIRAATKAAGRGAVLSYEYRNADTRTPAQRERDEITMAFDRADRLRDGPGFAGSFPVAAKAQAALAAWQAKYPAEAAKEAADKAAADAAEKARRDEQYRTSFVGRGID